MTGRICECGCGASLESKKANARYLDRAHKARARRSRQDPDIRGSGRKAAQLDGLYRSGRDGLQKAIRRDLAYREVLPAAFKNPADKDNDHRGYRRGSWRAYQDKNRELQRDRTDVDAGRHPRGRLGEKPKARKKKPFASWASFFPPRGGRYGPTGDQYVDSTTGKPFDHRDTMLYKGLGRDGWWEMNRHINRRFEIARQALKEGRFEELASRLGFEGLDYSDELWRMTTLPVIREFAAARVSARAALKGTEQRRGADMSLVAVPTDEQLADDALRLAEMTHELFALAVRLQARFPTSEVLAHTVERFLEGIANN
jgi:hypothetical protein